MAALLESGVSPNERDSNGRTPLHLCCSYDCFESAQLLLHDKTCDLNLPDCESGYTPLHRALYCKNYHIALLLLKHGAKALIRENENNYDDIMSMSTTQLQRERCMSPIDHEGLSPLDLLTVQLQSASSYTTGDVETSCTEVVAFGKADFFLGIVLPKAADDVLKPRPVSTLASLDIEYIACSKYHSAAITTDGRLYTWCDNQLLLLLLLIFLIPICHVMAYHYMLLLLVIHD